MDSEDRDNILLELEESPYLRRQKRVEVRRAMLRRRSASLLKKLLVVGTALAALSFVAYRTVAFGLHDPRFLVSEGQLQVRGLNHVTRQQVAEKFAGDVGRSIFLVPLARRGAMLEEISWVEAVAVARDWPNHLRVQVRERTPVAFLRTASELALVDAEGVVLERPDLATYTFPVLTGFSEQDLPDVRRERVGLYLALIEDLDRDGGRHSMDISEVDLSDPEDARVTVADRVGSNSILLHLGNTNFLARYRTYLTHIRQWRQQFKRIRSVDLRYERQIVVNPGRR